MYIRTEWTLINLSKGAAEVLPIGSLGGDMLAGQLSLMSLYASITQRPPLESLTATRKDSFPLA